MAYTIDMLEVGQTASTTKTITDTDIYLFAGITGDLNPAHVNDVYAKGTSFKGRIAHGLLCAGLISAVLGMQLPGNGSIYMGQEMKFTAPVYPGDTITATVEVSTINREKNVVELRTFCTNQDGVVTLDGKATLKAPLTA